MQKIKEVWEGREGYMAQKIRELAEEYDNIVVITGAAHVSNLENKLDGLSIVCIYIYNIGTHLKKDKWRGKVKGKR